MIDIQLVEQAALRRAVIALNNVDGNDDKIRPVGLKKETMIEQFAHRAEELNEQGVELPEEVRAFYNQLFSDEATEAVPDEMDPEDPVEDGAVDDPEELYAKDPSELIEKDETDLENETMIAQEAEKIPADKVDKRVADKVKKHAKANKEKKEAKLGLVACGVAALLKNPLIVGNEMLDILEKQFPEKNRKSMSYTVSHIMCVGKEVLRQQKKIM